MGYFPKWLSLGVVYKTSSITKKLQNQRQKLTKVFYLLIGWLLRAEQWGFNTNTLFWYIKYINTYINCSCKMSAMKRFSGYKSICKALHSACRDWY